jgi:septal ring-binding cell division protein DamX
MYEESVGTNSEENEKSKTMNKTSSWLVKSVAPDSDDISKTRLLCKPSSWLINIDFINHLVLFNNVLTVVLAENKGGKTSFINILQERLDLQIKSCIIKAQAPCDKGELVQTVSNAFHLKVDADKPMDMHSLVKQLNERKAHALLIIDDAHFLTEAWLKEMMEAIQQQEESSFFHLCLVSDFSIVASLNRLATTDTTQLIHTIELGSLTLNETKTYVIQTMASNRQADIAYSDDELNQLYKKTGGCLAKINGQLKTFMPGSAKFLVKKSAFAMKSKALAVSAAFMVVGSSMLLFSQHKQVTNPTTQTLAQSSVTDNSIVHLQEPVFQSEIAQFDQGAIRQLVQKEMPKKQMLTKFDVKDFNNVTRDKVEIDKPVTVPKINILEALHVTQKDASIIQPISQNMSEIPSSPKNTVTQGYTIQLQASPNLLDIKKFIDRYQLKENYFIRQVTIKSDTWYILTWGNYNKLSDAQSAVRDLSPEFLRFKPWIRGTAHLKSVG